MSASSSDLGAASRPTDASERVAALYDQHPYPDHGVVSSLLATLCGSTVARHRHVGLPPLRVLDAGCGTGEQTLGLARAFPDLEIVGVDFNRNSIERAEALRHRHGLSVQFLRRDLLAPLDDLGPFDIICCIGTLHHLPDPAIGLSNLCDAGRPGTTLVGMVYGRFGRSVWFDVRDAFRHLAPRAATRQDALDQVAALRWGRNFGAWHYANELRSRHRFGPRVPVIESVRRVLAGRNAAYQADAFTHEVEQSFTWAELSALASSAGWTLEGWPERSGMPDRPDQLFTEPTASDVRSLSLGEQAAMYERLVRPSNLYFLATRR